MEDVPKAIRVLVVEDDGIIAKGIERRLRRMEYDVVGLALCGQDAVRLAEELRPDVILMDIQLGAGIDGIEATEAIHRFLDSPVIFLTAYSDDATLGRAKLADPFGYVLKPYEDKDLQTAIEIGLYKHEMQRRLRENERWLAATLASIGDGVIATDEDGKIRLINAQAEQLTGWSEAEAWGKDLVDVFDVVNEHTKEPVPNPVTEVLASGAPGALAAETVLVSRNGDERPVDDSAAPIVDGDGKLSGAVLVFRDITEKRKFEELLRQTQKMESLGRLAGGIAHDFNNLLTIILGTGEMLAEDVSKEGELREMAESILDAGRRAASLTQQISAFSRKQMMEPRVLSLNDAISDLTGMVQRLVGANIAFVEDLEPDLSMVRIDPAQLSQIVLNLAVNARDAMPLGGKLTIVTANVDLDANILVGNPDAAPGAYAMLQISDTGSGIPPEALARVFEPFFTTKDAGKGTGLGLATVYGIVRQSNGHVEASSESDVGTTFRVYLPAVDEVPQAPVEDIHSLRGGDETILLVEDNDKVRQLANKVLTSLGYQVIEAGNGREGIEMSSTHKGHIDLLLTDLVMPEVGGRVAAETITRVRPDTRVLYMTGYSDDAEIQEGVEASRFKLLRKPFTREDLAAKIREVLDEA